MALFSQSKASGRILFDQVCKQLNLLEVDYFGLEYQDINGVTVSANSDSFCQLQDGSRLCFATPASTAKRGQKKSLDSFSLILFFLVAVASQLPFHLRNAAKSLCKLENFRSPLIHFLDAREREETAAKSPSNDFTIKVVWLNKNISLVLGENPIKSFKLKAKNRLLSYVERRAKASHLPAAKVAKKVLFDVNPSTM